MLYTKTTRGSVDEVTQRLAATAIANKFGVLGEHDLKERMAAKGVEFGTECRVLEVCNPAQAKKVLEADMSISTALPCRISIYEDRGKVTVSTLKPTALLRLFGNPGLEPVAREVEDTILRIIDTACE